MLVQGIDFLERPLAAGVIIDAVHEPEVRLVSAMRVIVSTFLSVVMYLCQLFHRPSTVPGGTDWS